MAKNVVNLWQEKPFRELRKEMDSLFDNFFGQGQLQPAPPAMVSPSIDIKEDEKAITMTAELPGMTEDDIDLKISNGLLTVSGEKKLERDEKKDNYHVMERQYGSFTRSVPLPDRVDESAIGAKFDKGVLTVTMPKKPGTESGTRKIKIGK